MFTQCNVCKNIKVYVFAIRVSVTADSSSKRLHFVKINGAIDDMSVL